jgi:hypothetical protein
MGSNQFDKIIKDKVQFHQAEVDSGLWDKIEAGITEAEKTRRFPIFWFISVSAVVLVSLGYVFYSQSEKSASKPSLPTDNKTYVSNDKKDKITPADNSLLTNDLSSEDQPGSTTAHSTLTNDHYFSSSQTVTKKRNKVSSLTVSDDNPVLTDNQTLSAATATTASLSNDEVALTGTESVYTLAPVSFLSAKNYQAYAAKGKKYPIKDNCLSDFSSSRKGIFAEVYFGNDFPIRKLTAREPAFENLAAARRESEKPLYSYSIGARLGFSIAKNFTLFTGVNYSQINEKFDYVDPESSQTKVIKTTLYIKDGMGNIKDSTFTFDTIMIPGTLVYKIRNQYTTIDLPFFLGYQVWKNDKVNIVLNAGVMANIMLKKEGMALLESTFSAANFNRQDSNTFNHSLGLSTMMGIQFNYNLTDHLDLYIEPNVRFQHRGLTSKEYPLRHSYYTISFLTGARYKF